MSGVSVWVLGVVGYALVVAFASWVAWMWVPEARGVFVLVFGVGLWFSLSFVWTFAFVLSLLGAK